MEATQTVHPNGDVENTIVLNPEESAAVLGIQNLSVTPMPSELSDEYLESIIDEALGINSQENTESVVEDVEYTEESSEEPTINMFPTEETTTETPVESPALINYDTMLESMTTTRFNSAEWFLEISSKDVLIGGIGGIGSWLAFLLARTNVRTLRLYDPDSVEQVNMAGQFFSSEDMGRNKAFAVNTHLRTFANFYRTYCYGRAVTSSDYYPIMMCGFDNMAARKEFFESWISHDTDPEGSLFIDGRLSAECFQVFCIQKDDPKAIDVYRSRYLFSDSEADATVCSYKQTSFMANMIAATMVNLFVNWCACKAGGFRPVPFFVEFDAITLQYKVQMNAI